MKSYVSRNTIALRKRVKKAHAKAKFAGVLYLLGTLALVAFACMPMLKIGGSPLSITNCFAMISGVSLGTISAVLYLLIVLTCVVNFFKCFRKLGWLSKRSERYVNGFNRNAGAMELMGKLFLFIKSLTALLGQSTLLGEIISLIPTTQKFHLIFLL